MLLLIPWHSLNSSQGNALRLLVRKALRHFFASKLVEKTPVSKRLLTRTHFLFKIHIGPRNIQTVLLLTLFSC